MITEQDLQAAIAECQGARNPTASTCLKLAAYYTIQDKMFGSEKDQPVHLGYSFANDQAEKTVDEITYLSDSDFSKLIFGRRQDEIWPVIDELMSVLEATNPRLYSGVIRKIKS